MADKNKIFEKYFSEENLKLAWERYIRSTGRDCKDFFGIEIFASSLDENLKILSDAIINGQYKPQRPFKYYEPKASKTHRTKSVLSIDDSLIYQSIANVVSTNNYKKITENNRSVFGSVLHPEVVHGTELLKNPNAEFYFFEYYLPLYNKFIDSVNTEIKNTDVKFKLETDITGFFDSIPHSKLLITLHEFGVESEILDLLQNSLNMYSGTRDSITPGVGIPQGAAASFFFANLFLYDLDYLISQKGFTYYRYMDDIRIYDETEEKIVEVLVLIDNYLKGKALSLNTKKTSIERIGENRENETLPFLFGYEADLGITNDKQFYVTEQNAGAEIDYLIQTIDGQELIDYCKKEICEVESFLMNRFQGIASEDFDEHNLANDESLKKEIIHIAYRWRNANSILKENDKPVLNENLIPIWLFCLKNFCWKANHFCWNLNQYGVNDLIKKELLNLLPKFVSFEWVRYQILSNMAFVQNFNTTELKDFFRKSKEEPSPLVRLGYYMILLKHMQSNQQLFASLRQAIKDDKEPYIRSRLFSFVSSCKDKNKIDELKFWFGL